MEKPTDAVDSFRSTIISAAADAVAKEMTPQAMHALAQAMVTRALADLSDDKYGSLQRLVKDAAEKIMKEYVQTPSVLAEIRAATEAGVNAAIPMLTAEIRGKVIDEALKSISDTFAKQKRGY